MKCGAVLGVTLRAIKSGDLSTHSTQIQYRTLTTRWPAHSPPWGVNMSFSVEKEVRHESDSVLKGQFLGCV